LADHWDRGLLAVILPWRRRTFVKGTRIEIESTREASDEKDLCGE
jgi:hypothetical protein